MWLSPSDAGWSSEGRWSDSPPWKHLMKQKGRKPSASVRQTPSLIWIELLVSGDQLISVCEDSHRVGHISADSWLWTVAERNRDQLWRLMEQLRAVENEIWELHFASDSECKYKLCSNHSIDRSTFSIFTHFWSVTVMYKSEPWCSCLALLSCWPGAHEHGVFLCQVDVIYEGAWRWKSAAWNRSESCLSKETCDGKTVSINSLSPACIVLKPEHEIKTLQTVRGSALRRAEAG